MITNEEVKNSLNKLRFIGSDPEFKKSSRALILSHEPKRAAFPGMLLLRFAGAFAVLILIVAALSFEFSPTPVLSSSFNPSALAKEFDGLGIMSQIEEVQYREKANQAIASALNEIESTDVKHLNNSLLQGEAENIELEDSTNPEIDALLETVIF